MSEKVMERYSPLVITSNGTVVSGSTDITGVGGFLCLAAGTLTITKSNGFVVINALACTAGNYYPMPFSIGFNFNITSAGGLQGVLGLQ